MKKLFIVLAAAFMAVNVNAAQGDMVLSGSLGLDISSTKPEGGDAVTTTNFEIAPSFTYFLSDKFGIGGKVMFDLNKVGEDDAVNTFGVGVFGRYYVLKTEKFGVFGQAGLDFRFPEDALDINLGVTPGIQYFINRKFSIELSLQNLLYLNYNSIKDVESTTNFGLSLNPNNVNDNPFAVNFAPLNLTLNYHF
ncbi:MAG: porin family protein [Prevotellaceae bacterium]|jgi:hypothetical protein|nr:porin family protein [Prevotellaceae bacterium]